jgi:hypothetical protein
MVNLAAGLAPAKESMNLSRFVAVRDSLARQRDRFATKFVGLRHENGLNTQFSTFGASFA